MKLGKISNCTQVRKRREFEINVFLTKSWKIKSCCKKELGKDAEFVFMTADSVLKERREKIMDQNTKVVVSAAIIVACILLIFQFFHMR